MVKRIKKILFGVIAIIAIGFLIPEDIEMPVEGANNTDYHPESFWYYPWGKSVTHKGVDIFSDKGTSIHPSTNGIIIYAGKLSIGGNVILMLGPKWRLHYYAHLDAINSKNFSLVTKKDIIGTVGDSGNASGKPPHLHYSILSIIPYPWRIDSEKQGWKKMFYLNPIDYFE